MVVFPKDKICSNECASFARNTLYEYDKRAKRPGTLDILALFSSIHTYRRSAVTIRYWTARMQQQEKTLENRVRGEQSRPPMIRPIRTASRSWMQSVSRWYTGKIDLWPSIDNLTHVSCSRVRNCEMKWIEDAIQ